MQNIKSSFLRSFSLNIKLKVVVNQSHSLLIVRVLPSIIKTEGYIKNINYKTIFGSNFKEIRKDHHFTQEELSEQMNLTAQHLSYIESGKRAPSFDFIISASKALQIEPSEFFEFNEKKISKHKKSATLKKVGTLAEMMSEKELKVLLKIIQLLRNPQK